MNKFLAILQMLAALLLGVMALATLVNLVLISTRPETISVVNAMIGQGVVIICLAAASRIIFRRGRAKYTASDNSAENAENP